MSRQQIGGWAFIIAMALFILLARTLENIENDRNFDKCMFERNNAQICYDLVILKK